VYNDSLLIFNESAATSNTPLFIIGNGGGNTTRSNAMVVYKTGNVEINGVLKINDGTNEWTSTPTGFAANRTAALSVTPSTFTDVLFTTQSADDGGDNYDPATGEFTVPTAGMYRFEASVYWAGAIAGFENLYFYVNGATKRFHSIVSANTGAHTLPFTASFKLNAGDVVKVVAYHTNATAVNISANVNGTYFTGVKVY
jgi:C1q domain